MINDFKFGPIQELNSHTELETPFIWMALAPSKLEKGYDLMTFDIYILDQSTKDGTNLETLMSDTLLYGRDILNQYRNSDLDEDYMMMMPVDVAPITLEFDSVYSGWNFTFNIEILDGDKCNIPL